MKKYLIAILLILILPSISFSVGVEDIYPEYKKYNYPTKSVVVPTKIVTKNVITKSKTIAMNILKPRLGELGMLMVFNGLVWGGSELFDYVLEKAAEPVLHNKDGLLYKYEDGGVVPPCTVASNVVWHCCADSTSAAYAECRTYAETCGSPVNLCGQTGARGYNSGKWHYVMTGTPTYERVETPAEEDDIRNALNLGLNQADDDAKNVSEKIVDQASTAYNADREPVPGAKSLSDDPILADKVKTAMNDSLTDEENVEPVTELEDEAANVSQNDIVDQAKKDATSTDTNAVTVGNVMLGVRNGLRSFFGDISPPNVPEPTHEVPDKSNLTEVLTNFTSAINSLPIVSTLNGISVSCAGSPALCLNLPQKYGGTICYNGENIQGTLNAIGTACLSIITLISFIYIFRG